MEIIANGHYLLDFRSLLTFNFMFPRSDNKTAGFFIKMIIIKIVAKTTSFVDANKPG